jgi:hypothetical protein
MLIWRGGKLEELCEQLTIFRKPFLVVVKTGVRRLDCPLLGCGGISTAVYDGTSYDYEGVYCFFCHRCKGAFYACRD